MKRTLLIMLLCGILPHLLSAQGTTRSGTVTDDTGIPVERVSIQVKGTTTGTYSDSKGRFSIAAPDNAVLVFTMIGFNRVELAAGAVTPGFVVKLARSESQLTEVVVTALGVNRSRNQMPYSVQTIKGDEVSRNRTSNFMQGLSGKIAGLNIQQGNVMGASTNVTLRGMRSITGENQALFVVDGIPYANANGTRNTANTSGSGQRSGTGGYDYGSTAQDFNPDDIATITVLKGAAASALYGSQGANGVILITTKKAAKGLGVTVNLGTTRGSLDKKTFPKFQTLYGGGYFAGKEDPSGYFYMRDLDGDGQADDLMVALEDDASYGHRFDPNLMVWQWDSFDPTSPNYGKPRPWVAGKNAPDKFFRNAWSTNVSVFAEGGSDKGTFKIGYTRNDDQGILENSRILKNLVNVTGTLNITSRLTATASVNFTNIKGKGRWGTGYDGSEGKNIMTSLRQWWQTNVDILEQREAYFRTGRNVTWNPKSNTNLTANYWNNPYWTIYENYQDDTRNRYFGNISLNYKITDWLNLMGRVSRDGYSELREERVAVGSTAPGKYLRTTRDFAETNFDLLLNFDKNIGKKTNLKALLGTNIRNQRIENFLAQTNGGLIAPKLYSLANTFNPVETPVEYLGRREVQGVFSGATLTWNEMLSLDATLRRDAASTLPKGDNTYYYPSVSGGFTFSRLLPLAKWLSYGKLRANYAQVGSDAPISSIKDTYESETAWGSLPTYSLRNTKNNTHLRPEQTRSIEGGLEMAFFDSRLGFDVTYYTTKTIDQIIPVVTSNASGYSGKYLNAGVVENKGLEISLHGTPVKTEDFTWDINANWSRNRNKVVELIDGSDNIQLSFLQGNVSLNAVLGQPFGVIRGSDFIYTNGKRTVGADGYYLRTSTVNEIIGDPNPDWFGGINNQFRYKDFLLSFLIDMRKGGDIFSLDQYYGLSQGIYRESALVNENGVNSREPVSEGGGILLDGVTADGKPNEVRVRNEYGTLGDYRTPNKAYVYDGSYIKLREVIFSYALPKTMLARLSFVKGLDLSLIGRNLWIIHKNLPNSDPEENLGAGNLQGYQSGAYPTTRTIAFNLKFKF